MFEGLKNIFKKTGKVVKATPGVTTKVIKEEIEEIKDLTLTETDKLQADVITGVAITAMAALGIPASTAVRDVMQTAIAYGIRDLKEGNTNPQKLIVMRVVNAYKERIEMRNFG